MVDIQDPSEIKEYDYLGELGDGEIVEEIKCTPHKNNQSYCLFKDGDGETVAYTPTHRVAAEGETFVNKGTTYITNIGVSCESYRIGSSYSNYICEE